MTLGSSDGGKGEGGQGTSKGFIYPLLGGGPAPCGHGPIFRIGNRSAWNEVSCPGSPDTNVSALLTHSIFQTPPIIKPVWVLIKNIDAQDPHNSDPTGLERGLGPVFTMYLGQHL